MGISTAITGIPACLEEAHDAVAHLFVDLVLDHQVQILAPESVRPPCIAASPVQPVIGQHQIDIAGLAGGALQAAADIDRKGRCSLRLAKPMR